MKKKDLTDIDSQIKELIADCKGKEFPRNKRLRNGEASPLTAWMLGVSPSCKSKIIEVTEGRPWYPYQTLSASVCVLCERIAKRYQMTDVQYQALMLHVFKKYRGRDTSRYCPPCVLDTESVRVFDGMDINVFELPLRAIINQRLTDLILLKVLFKTVKGK